MVHTPNIYTFFLSGRNTIIMHYRLSVVFVDSHENQRDGVNGESILTYRVFQY